MTGSHARSCPLQEQTLAWALHAVEPEEEVEVLAHLPGCPACRETVRETEEVAALLGGALEQTDPPRALRGRILAAAAETPRDHAPRPVPEATVLRPRFGTRVRSRVVGVVLAAAVAVAAIAGLGVYSAQLKAERDAEAARAQSVVAMMQGLTQPGTTHAFLSAQQGGPAVAAVVVTGQGQMVLPMDLTANPDDHTYVLWGVPESGAPTPLGTFDVHSGAAGAESVRSSSGGAGFAQFAISVEPGRVAPASPTDVVASGRAEV
jgi:anti-sigma-K factor RskA